MLQQRVKDNDSRVQKAEVVVLQQRVKDKDECGREAEVAECCRVLRRVVVCQTYTYVYI